MSRDPSVEGPWIVLCPGPVRPAAAVSLPARWPAGQEGLQALARRPEAKKEAGKAGARRPTSGGGGAKALGVGAVLCAIQAAVQEAKLVPAETEGWAQVQDVLRRRGWAPWRYRHVFNQDLFKEFRAIRSSQWPWEPS